MAALDLVPFLPTHITDGGYLLPDGSAVGLVAGGAPAWELVAGDAQRAIAATYRQVLLALHTPLDVYLVDQPLELEPALRALVTRQARTPHPVQTAILGELADRLAAVATTGATRAKQVVWAVRWAAPGQHQALQPWRRWRQTGSAAAAPTDTLSLAVAAARHLAERLAALGGQPAPYVLPAEAIVQLWYAQVDPMRTRRAPLAGALLTRLQGVLAQSEKEVGHGLP